MDNILKWLQKNIAEKRSGLITGLSDVGKAYFLSEMGKSCQRMLIMVASEEKAYDLQRELAAFGQKSVDLFLAHDFVFAKETLSAADIERMCTLQKLLGQPEDAYQIIVTPGALVNCILSPESLTAKSCSLYAGAVMEPQLLVNRLVAGGYSRVMTLSCPGEIAVRGGIVDIFPLGSDHPSRVEFFGDEIESIRSFHLEDQRSLGKIKELTVPPATDQGAREDKGTLFDYLRADTLLFIDEPQAFYKEFEENHLRLQKYFNAVHKEQGFEMPVKLLREKELAAQVARHVVISHSYFSADTGGKQPDFTRHIICQDMEPFFRRYEVFIAKAKSWQQKGYQLQVFIDQPTFLNNIREEMKKAGITRAAFHQGNLDKGFISPTFQVAVVTEFDLRGKSKLEMPKPKNAKATQRILLEDLKLGDYVVHDTYGIGIFHGVTYDTIDGITKEYILLQYAGSDRLYLPIEKLHLLHKYSGVGEGNPRLHKLGGTEWERTRKKVERSIHDMADELIQLYAMREKVEGIAFSPDTPWQQQFEEEFPYQETPGQLAAIADVKQDMESKKPMDRLICGDVGYGKTEVAMRAAFKALMEGKQIAILVPTTVLAEQHYQTLQARFANYPANIEVLSRFRTATQQKKTIRELKAGSIDIVVATHRLLSKDVSFHDLGLLIIDEEHRFGVAQKEKIKALRTQVDVLSLSATPIPRSLHMAMSGLRDLSVIDTPPPKRYPVTTYVMEYEPQVIKDAIEFELSRQGQVFFVHNRVQDIHVIQRQISELVPEAKVMVGHGQMPEAELEAGLLAFSRGDFDIFLCTTIIESGLDMPNVNTLIVHMAEYMGLAQLYQLRGRVGRSERMAYAYITYQANRSIGEVAQKRLNALRDFNELGSGMKIAMRDLEIRGAGNMLGGEQHGHIHAVGFDLYCRILEEETQKIRGLEVKSTIGTQLDIDLDYYIPDTYIPEAGTRMRIYRRLLLSGEIEEIEELRREITDRFGPIPPMVENFLQIAKLRISAQGKQVKSLRRKGNQLFVTLDFDAMVRLAQHDLGQKVKIIDQQTLLITVEKHAPLKELEKIIAVI